MKILKILYIDQDLVIIDKPSGYHVHQPENGKWLADREKVCLYLLRDQLKQYIYPVHRLDVATSGCMVFALNSATAGLLQKQIQDKAFLKKYYALVRGFTPMTGTIDTRLKSDSSEETLEAYTTFTTLKKYTLPFLAGKLQKPAKYSLIDVSPHTGRYHQIRRHMAGKAHPILGDSSHGDSHQNRSLRDYLNLSQLWLRSYALEFLHPHSQEKISVITEYNENWMTLFEKFNNFEE